LADGRIGAGSSRIFIASPTSEHERRPFEASGFGRSKEGEKGTQ
jgi:hypothetical protein